ncbi:uncharacterized protein LOC126739978 [Anthonomus grandis grandis]|uniref:uncharacterized protein LOC126739978 n=1 Tax=Anthonomus grandis grandis TaxID=2921223 RepID=UPI0021652906|nr:uncharacterized protein LOC126739978 [Anthonomus grandis grandis]
MKMAHSMQGIYAPLPQSLSDSESEKEISMEPICTSYNSKANFEESYRQNGHSIQLDGDVVKIKRGASKMSLARKVAFVCSIILCLSPIFIFLWVLPCNELHTCPVKITNWEYEQEDIELKGPINVVSGVYKTNYNLAMLYKGSFNSPKTLKNGIISFMGLTGNVAWYFEQEVEPLQMDCNIIDTNKDGSLECLVVDSKGLKAIETASGQALWHAHSAEENQLVKDLDLPIAIPDLNADGVNELLSIYQKYEFLVISGRTGKALSKIPLAHCENIKEIYKSKATTADSVTYRCINSSGNSLIFRVSISEIEKTVTNPQYHMTAEQVPEEIEENVYYVGNRKLVVENGKNCPKCHCNLTLFYEKDQTSHKWSYNNAYIMNPKSFSFEPTAAKKAKLRGHLNGFIIKIWQWSEHYRKLRPTQRINKRGLIYSSANETFFSTEVTARVVLITFNDTDVNVINASLTDINQICKKHDSNCQPSVENQSDSLLVQDLENDNSRELVNFYSSYIRRGEDWHLVSYVKVLRLEEELPKLYGNK